MKQVILTLAVVEIILFTCVGCSSIKELSLHGGIDIEKGGVTEKIEIEGKL